MLNKNLDKKICGEFTLSGTDVTYTVGEVYFVEALSEKDKEAGWKEVIKKDDVKIEVKDGKFTYTLPKLSVAHIILK